MTKRAQRPVRRTTKRPTKIETRPSAVNDDTRAELGEIEQRLFQLDAVLVSFAKTCEGSKIETDDGEWFAPAQPIAIVRREIEALRTKVGTVLRDVEREIGVTS